MNNISVNQFRDHLKHYADLAIQSHEVITVTRRKGEDIVIMSAEDWHSIEETLFVLENPRLMLQIHQSLESHLQQKGRPLTPEESDEINRI